MEYKFIWDENKNASNYHKHGVSFETAKEVFYDPMRNERFDKKHSLIEERWRVIGMVGWKVLAIICKEENGLVRIISARKADKKETEVYFYGYNS